MRSIESQRGSLLRAFRLWIEYGPSVQCGVENDIQRPARFLRGTIAQRFRIFRKTLQRHEIAEAWYYVGIA